MRLFGKGRINRWPTDTTSSRIFRQRSAGSGSERMEKRGNVRADAGGDGNIQRAVRRSSRASKYALLVATTYHGKEARWPSGSRMAFRRRHKAITSSA